MGIYECMSFLVTYFFTCLGIYLILEALIKHQCRFSIQREYQT